MEPSGFFEHGDLYILVDITLELEMLRLELQHSRHSSSLPAGNLQISNTPKHFDEQIALPVEKYHIRREGAQTTAL